MVPFILSTLEKGRVAIIQQIKAAYVADPIAQRLCDLGFAPGEQVQITARAPFTGDPILVKIGKTYLALRSKEAARVWVSEERS